VRDQVSPLQMRLARPSTPYANTTIAVLVAKVESKSFAEVKAKPTLTTATQLR